MDHPAKGKTKQQLLDEICSGSEPGSQIFEQLRASIMIECTRDLEFAVNEFRGALVESSRSSDSLSRKLYWLNFVLMAATVVIAFGTLVMALK